jgi:hypothetical protein
VQHPADAVDTTVLSHRQRRKVDAPHSSRLASLRGLKWGVEMRWFGYAWLILFNTFCIVVVLAVFAKLFERPDVILVAILGLIYIAIEVRGAAQNVGITEGLMQLRKQVLEVRRLLNDVNFGSEAETIWQTEKAISDVMPRYYINQFFRGLISLICLFVLGLKLLGS